MNRRHTDWLLQLTDLPTAAGQEQRVAAWVRAWANRRRDVIANEDRHGNMVLRQIGLLSRNPIFFTAHMDHPALVVIDRIDDRRLRAELRGGVHESYCMGSRVLYHHLDGHVSRGLVQSKLSAGEGSRSAGGGGNTDLVVIVTFKEKIHSTPGDVLTWDVGPPRIRGDRFHAPVCDDLAGVSAALAAFDTLRASRRGSGADIRVLLTRAEEVGFLGAIAACKGRTIPKASRLIALETSKSFPNHSPIGAGPIVRIGDRTSSFDPILTDQVCQVARQIAQNDSSFRWQRKLMPGGTCEASAFQAYGYSATCVCLALGNYHNMCDQSGRIAAETISLSDYHGLIRLLVETGKGLAQSSHLSTLRSRLETIFKDRKGILKPGAGWN